MNKETVLKYLEEFHAFLENKQVYAYFKNGGHRRICAFEDFGTHLDYCFIDDKYSEFRKALAKGKTVEYYVDGFTGWQPVKTIGNHFDGSYRIKPDEPKFKNGDWVRDKVNGTVTRLKDNYHPGGIEHWKPKEGEWCWFWDISTKAFRILAKYKNSSTEWYPHQSDYGRFNHCEPFLGDLPTGLEKLK